MQYGITFDQKLPSLEQKIDFCVHKLLNIRIDDGDLQRRKLPEGLEVFASPALGLKPPRHTDTQRKPRLELFQLLHQDLALDLRELVKAIQDQIDPSCGRHCSTQDLRQPVRCQESAFLFKFIRPLGIRQGLKDLPGNTSEGCSSMISGGVIRHEKEYRRMSIAGVVQKKVIDHVCHQHRLS